MKAKDDFFTREQARLARQTALDALRTQTERNRMGQFATPSALALDILAHAKKLLPPGSKIRFLDPALGTGAFYSALLRIFPQSRLAAAMGYEIDPHYGHAAREVWEDTGLAVHLTDFTRSEAPGDGFNLLVCNPPYVRHHHIINGEKARLLGRVSAACDMQPSGLAGLYCYFLFLSHTWMTKGGLAGWLIPSEFMDVNYGEAVKRYLLDKVTLLHIHRFDPNEVQFGDALVSSAVVWFRNEPPPPGHSVEFSYGGTLLAPKTVRPIPAEILRFEPKWTRFPMSAPLPKTTAPSLADFFSIRRGLATGDNDYFILTAEQISRFGLPSELFRPILPSPRYLPVNEVEADEQGNPLIDRPLFLLDCRLPETEIRAMYPALWRYLEEGKARNVAERYLCLHRSPWYSQENRPAAPLVCTYLGRANLKSGRPFRFILNRSNATVTNVYLALYPKEPLASIMRESPEMAREVWTILNRICPNAMLAEGRVYGGGLHKLEPKELANVPASELAALLTRTNPRSLLHETPP
jgi:hypothetical protein